MDWNKLWDDIVNFFKSNVWNIVLFFAVLILGIIIIKIIINITKRVLKKTKIEKIAVGFFIVSLKLVLYLCLVLGLLSIIGVNISGVITALSALVLAIGLALQNIIANAANGLVIISSKMFKEGDYISVDGVEGSVTNINFLFTTIKTPDNKRITIPNSSIVNKNVIDFDAHKTRRVEIKFEAAYESDVESVKQIVLACFKSNGNILLNPEPTCRLSGLKSSGIEFVCRCWCDKEDYWNVYFDMTELIFNELKKNKVSIPYTQLEIRQRTDKVVLPYNKADLPERVEKQREEKIDYDLENIDIKKVIKHRKQQKLKKKASASKTKKAEEKK